MSEKNCLLILTSSYPSDENDGRAAAGFFVKDFANELSCNNEIIVLTQCTGKKYDEAEEKNFPVIRFPWLGSGRPLSTLKLPKDFILILSVIFSGAYATFKEARKQKFDHIIAMWAIPCGLWALILNIIYKVPYSVWCLGADIWDYQKSYLSRFILKIILKKADIIYADGYELRDTIKDIADVDCIFLPSSRKYKAIGHKYSLEPNGVRHYLFIGRYHLNKGPDLLLDAIGLLPEEIKTKLHFHFFGGGSIETLLKSKIENLKLEEIVTLGGFIGEKKFLEVISASDVIIIPSRKDSISLMLSAAMQMNKSVIAMDTGDTGYLLKKYKAGQVVPLLSAESLVKAIIKDISSPEDFDKGRSELKKIFDLSNSAKIITEKIKSNH